MALQTAEIKTGLTKSNGGLLPNAQINDAFQKQAILIKDVLFYYLRNPMYFEKQGIVVVKDARENR